MKEIDVNDAEEFCWKIYEAELIIKKYKQFWFVRILLLLAMKIVMKGL